MNDFKHVEEMIERLGSCSATSENEQDRDCAAAADTMLALLDVADRAKIITVNTSSHDITESGDCCAVPIGWLENLDDALAKLQEQR